MAPAGPARLDSDRRYDQSPTPARVSGVYAIDDAPATAARAATPEPARRAARLDVRQPTRAWRPSVPALHAALRTPGAPSPWARRLPQPLPSSLRPAVPRAPVIEVQELDGRDAAYVALLELAIADDEWDQEELTQVYAASRRRPSARPKAPREALDRMLDELVAVTIDEDWEDDPITNQYASFPSDESGRDNALRPTVEIPRAPARSAHAAPPMMAARRAGGWRPAVSLPTSWRR